MSAVGPAEETTASPGRTLVRSVFCVTAAFGTYFCMYAFRKPFTAARYDDTTFLGIPYKTVLVIAQVLGYMLSKFIGIKVIAEMPPAPRQRGDSARSDRGPPRQRLLYSP